MTLSRTAGQLRERAAQLAALLAPTRAPYVFESIEQVQEITDDWLVEYNEQRPHDFLGRVPPLTYMPREITAGESSFGLST